MAEASSGPVPLALALFSIAAMKGMTSSIAFRAAVTFAELLRSAIVAGCAPEGALPPAVTAEEGEPALLIDRPSCEAEEEAAPPPDEADVCGFLAPPAGDVAEVRGRGAVPPPTAVDAPTAVLPPARVLASKRSFFTGAEVTDDDGVVFAGILFRFLLFFFFFFLKLYLSLLKSEGKKISVFMCSVAGGKRAK